MNKYLEVYFPLLIQLFRFGIVGLTAAAVNLSVVVVLVHYWQFMPLVANVFGFMIAFQFSYWGHRLWTFSDTITLHRVALPKLLFVQTLNLSANELLFYFFLMMGFPYFIALFFVLCILPIFTFLLSKRWVFR